VARASDPSGSIGPSLLLIAMVLALTALYFGRQIFIPLALALVFSFLLTPLVSFLEKLRLRRVPAALVVMALSFLLLGTVAWKVANQLVEITVNLADYKTNLDEKIKSLHVQANGNLSKATATVQELNRELAAVPGEISSNHGQESHTRPAKPIAVQVTAPPSNFVQDLRALLGPLAEPLETGAMVTIFTLFMLIKREDLRNRVIRLAGHGRLNLMTQALDDAGRRLSRYLLMQCLVNIGYGLVFGLGLYLIGIPNALLWGVFAGLLRFVPYVGTFIAAALPALLALAVFPGWHAAGLVCGIFIVLELLVGNIFEPWLYGAHTGISSLAILVAAVFWATIWGPVGLILSTPLTVCLIVLGRHVPQLKFLEVVLGDEPVLLPEQCYYQRLLAMDPDEARDIAEGYLKQNSLESLYDSLILPALKLAEHDHQTGSLDDSARKFILQTVSELVEEMGAQDDEQSESESRGTSERYRSPVLTACLPASAGSDEIVAVMLAQLLRHDGIDAREFGSAAAQSLSMEVAEGRYRLVCISSIWPSGAGQARSLCKRLKATVPSLKMVVGMWSFERAAAEIRLGMGCNSSVTTSLSDALAQIRQMALPADVEETLVGSGPEQ
jgi:predicted PurR-regulated permease PerM